MSLYHMEKSSSKFYTEKMWENSGKNLPDSRYSFWDMTTKGSNWSKGWSLTSLQWSYPLIQFYESISEYKWEVNACCLKDNELEIDLPVHVYTADGQTAKIFFLL